MKRITVMLAALLLLLSGCSRADVSEIEDYVWLMSAVQSMEAEGEIVAYGGEKIGAAESAVQIELRCQAENGVITLTDESGNKTYSGTYQLEERDPKATIYKIVVGETEGVAVAAETVYHNGENRPTLVMQLEDYTLNFFEDAGGL